MKTISLTEPVSKLLDHMNRTGGYMVCDPIKVPAEAFEDAKNAGLITVDWDGTAMLTFDGMRMVRWWLRSRA